jgi:hypothetical protein
MGYDLREREEQPPPARRWSHLLQWPVLLTVTWVLYELTAQPALATFVICCKFGWNDFQTARWLRRIDPERGRGWACFWIHLAWGLLKIMLTGLCMLIGLFVVAVFTRLPRGAPGGPGFLPVILGAVSACAGGFAASMLVSYLAFWCAWRSGARLWLGKTTDRARRARVWPSLYSICWGANEADGLLLLVSALTLVAFAGLTTVAGAWLGRQAGLALPGVMLFAGAGILAGSVVLLRATRRLQRRIIARTPFDCWGLTPPGDRESP